MTNDRNVVSSKVIRIANAREHQQMWRADCSRTKNHLPGGYGFAALTPTAITHGHSFVASKFNSLNKTAGLDREITPSDGGVQIGDRGAASDAVAYGCLRDVNTVLGTAVVVSSITKPELLPRLQECIIKDVSRLA